MTNESRAKKRPASSKRRPAGGLGTNRSPQHRHAGGGTHGDLSGFAQANGSTHMAPEAPVQSVAGPPDGGPDMAARGAATTAGLIARTLEEDIVLGRSHPRERLVELDLCERFHTHRGDVRLALFELEKKGIVQRVPNRGATVRDLTPQEVREIYAVRENVEVMAATILPLPVPPDDLDKLERLQRRHSAAVDAGDMLTVFYSNLHFHRTLFDLCRNACLIETIEHLAQKVHGIRSYANAFPEALDRVRQDHREMIEALRAGHRDDLIALTRRHLKPSPAAYIRAYERRFGDSVG